MNVHPDVNFEELARSTDDFNGAQLKAVCVEAGMLALRRDATEVSISICVFLLCVQYGLYTLETCHLLSLVLLVVMFRCQAPKLCLTLNVLLIFA